MRIIAGTKRGMKLLSPKTQVSRPITDRVKESLFSVLYKYDLPDGIMVADLELRWSRITDYARMQISIHNIGGRNIASVHFVHVLGPNAAFDEKRRIAASIEIRGESS